MARRPSSVCRQSSVVRPFTFHRQLTITFFLQTVLVNLQIFEPTMTVYCRLAFQYGHVSKLNGGMADHHNVSLAADEYIYKVVGKSHNTVGQLTFYIKDETGCSRTVGPYGNDCEGGTLFSAEGNYLKYITGRAGMYLDKLQLVFNDGCICNP